MEMAHINSCKGICTGQKRRRLPPLLSRHEPQSALRGKSAWHELWSQVCRKPISLSNAGETTPLPTMEKILAGFCGRHGLSPHGAWPATVA